MADVQLQIQLEPGPWEGEQYLDCWPVGGRIRGNVQALATEQVKARGVRVELEWHTEGRGDRDHEVTSSEMLHGDNLFPDQEYRWPFELAVPTGGPISYAGNLLSILWKVRVVVDIPWGRDIREEYPIHVLPAYEVSGIR